MASLLFGAFLIFILLLVHFSSQRIPLTTSAPLDVEQGLQLPAIGLASTVFSLTGLFGVYLGLYLVLGPTVLAGLGFGGGLSLLLIRSRVKAQADATFETFLRSRASASSAVSHNILWNLLAAAQLSIAASELIILREVALRGFALPPRYATVFALGAALIAYFYCLRGGYAAVFRTDIVQLLFVVTMFFVITLYAFMNVDPVRTQLPYASRVSITPELMYSPLSPSQTGARILDFLVGTLLGFGFLTISPDTWKRVHITTATSSGGVGFSLLLFASIFPLILILPFRWLSPIRSMDSPDPLTALAVLASHEFVFAVLLIGMVSCFLSSFDSALLAATHVRIVQIDGGRQEYENSISTYRILLAFGFLGVTAVALGMIAGVGNPYFLANVAMGLVGILSGLVAGTFLLSRVIERELLVWGALFAFTAWVVYIASIEGIFESASLQQLKTVPAGSVLFIAFLLLGYLSSAKKGV